jgi:flavin reductase (DIM6/NTAB) family NADH-FMN oxidoreductase RutF
MLSFDISTLTLQEKMNWLQHAIAPRPVCFASTIDKDGNANLSPFSFFNLFSCNPPIVIFSPARSGRTNTAKHTLQNVLEVPEVVIHICDYDMVQQVSLTSCEFGKDVDEFVKAGFTKQAPTIVKPPMVKEAKVKFECKVIEVKSLGETGGAGQLVFAEILKMHVDENILTDDKKTIAQQKFQQVARLGGDWYCVVNEESLFKVAKPNAQLGIGVDALPESVRKSKILSGNNLGQLANVHEMPVVDTSFDDPQLKSIIQYYSIDPEEMKKEIHFYAKHLLDMNKVNEAWQILLAVI